MSINESPTGTDAENSPDLQGLYGRYCLYIDEMQKSDGDSDANAKLSFEKFCDSWNELDAARQQAFAQSFEQGFDASVEASRLEIQEVMKGTA